MSRQACTLLVSSCDNYRDLWAPYFALIRRHWPDCPFPMALISEESVPNLPVSGVENLCLGGGHDWSSLLKMALERVRTPVVLLSLEDFFLRRRVDTNRILRLLDLMNAQNIPMLRLSPRPGPNKIWPGNEEIGVIEPGAPYRVSTQAALWRVSVLHALLSEGESAWEFERAGSRRSSHLDKFASVWAEAFPYRHHVIERGEWFPWSAKRFVREDIGVDLSARPVMSTRTAVSWIGRKAMGPALRWASTMRHFTIR